jgi:hypothetical protein
MYSIRPANERIKPVITAEIRMDAATLPVECVFSTVEPRAITTALASTIRAMLVSVKKQVITLCTKCEPSTVLPGTSWKTVVPVVRVMMVKITDPTVNTVAATGTAGAMAVTV